ncbi:MAG: hypothetical protein WDO15_25970 [Bacteroidota bacterium]
MKSIVQKRNNLFLSYLRLRSNSMKDKAMAQKFDSLSEMLSNGNITTDSSVRTSQKKSTTNHLPARHRCYRRTEAFLLQ